VIVERVVTSGTFSLDGQDFDVDNNIWLVSDDDGGDGEVVVVDAAHDHEPIVEAVGGRRVTAIVCTHGHNDHINAALALAEAVEAPVALHGDDLVLWRQVFPSREPDRLIADGDVFTAGTVRLTALHTPGHSPGGVCLYDGDRTLFSGDTLFNGGPGATGRSFSDFPTIVRSIRTRLLVLPDDTVVHTGHGDDTRIGDERENVPAVSVGPKGRASVTDCGG
jgi:glyoxylase-like metal-dependent hydrolase (beta-lactamase superfamily II)